ncbi:MAG: aldehyde dehydrogenase family protein [Myxococcales bacterium]|nr:aldehyde dehydrogenase family protein [Myxococcales bacterium]
MSTAAGSEVGGAAGVLDGAPGVLDGATGVPDGIAVARAKVAGVRAAQAAWAALPVAERCDRLRAAGRHLLERSDELAALVCAETGKPLAEGYSAEVLGVADLFHYWCRKAPHLLAPRKGEIPALDLPKKTAWIERVPRGVVACISPWNFPVALPMRTLVPALAAGNGVVLKPSEWTPRSGVWLVERLRESLGGVVDVLEGDGAAGAALVEAGPDHVVFTGSTRTGRKVAVACAERGIACELELGGKDCAVVLDDCDVERAAAGIAWGIVMNAGQNCAAVERVAVHAGVADRFVPALRAALDRTRADVPGLVTPLQRAIVIRHIEDALGRGAELVIGGAPDGGGPVPPTLLRGVPHDAPAWADESFGPIAALDVGRDDDALVAAANDSRYGLGASVWGQDLARCREVAARLKVGMVWINNHSFTGALPDLPWVGVGESGSGITNSPEAMLHLTRPRLLLIDRSSAIEPWWYPYGDTMVGLMKVLIRRQQHGGLGATLAALKALHARNKVLKAHTGPRRG